MLIDGAKINIPFEKDIIIFRPEKNVVLHVAAVPYEKEFEALCPTPQPPIKRDLEGNAVEIDYKDKKYKQAFKDWTEQRFNFMVLKSIRNVQWESVLLEDKNTWHNWRQEALSQGFTDPEVYRILNETLAIHSPSQEMMDKMREDFLASTRQKAETADQSSQDTEKDSI